MRACEMVLMDSSPLIYLAKAGELDLLLNFSVKIFIADEVYRECLSGMDKGTGEMSADALAIQSFVEEHLDHLIVVETTLGRMLQTARANGTYEKMPNAGEITAQEVYERRGELIGRGKPVLLIFEDTEVPLRFRTKDVHLLSTYGLLVAMEDLQLLDSADRVLDRIPLGERPAKQAVDVSMRGDTEYRSKIKGPG